jgi:hypothetical protein
MGDVHGPTMSRCAPSRISAASGFRRTIPTSRSHWSRPVELSYATSRHQPTTCRVDRHFQRKKSESRAPRWEVAPHRGRVPNVMSLRFWVGSPATAVLETSIRGRIGHFCTDRSMRETKIYSTEANWPLSRASESPGRCYVVAISARCPPLRGVSLPSRSTCLPRVSFLFHTLPIPFYGQTS